VKHELIAGNWRQRPEQGPGQPVTQGEEGLTFKIFSAGATLPHSWYFVICSIHTYIHTYTHTHTHIHTHTHAHPFNGPLSGTTQVSRYQKGKTNLDFTEARDSEWQWHQLYHMQVCTLLQTDNHTSTPPLSFLQAGCSSCRPTNSVRALKSNWHVIYSIMSINLLKIQKTHSRNFFIRHQSMAFIYALNTFDEIANQWHKAQH